MRFSRILALVVMVAGSLMAGVAVVNIQQVNATTNNNSIITEPQQGDFNVIVPPIENTIDCNQPSSLVPPYGDCIGTFKNDKMMGTNQGDNITSRHGDDYILGGKGSDALAGSNGNDLLYGELGNDWISGGNGTDRLYGGVGNDKVHAGSVNYYDGPFHIIGNRTEFPPYKDFADCGEGYDKVFVDVLDVYKNCEVVYGVDPDMTDINRDISNLTGFPIRSMDTYRDISNLTRFP